MNIIYQLNISRDRNIYTSEIGKNLERSIVIMSTQLVTDCEIATKRLLPWAGEFHTSPSIRLSKLPRPQQKKLQLKLLTQKPVLLGENTSISSQAARLLSSIKGSRLGNFCMPAYVLLSLQFSREEKTILRC